MLYSPVMWWISSARVFTLADDFSHATKPSHVVQPSAPGIQAALTFPMQWKQMHRVYKLKHGAVLFLHEYFATP